MAKKNREKHRAAPKPAASSVRPLHPSGHTPIKPLRIVIDMQGAQTESRYRGIGRYTMAFAQAIVWNRGDHEVILALSGLFPDTIEPIRAAFDGLLPQENIRVWHAPGPVKEEQPSNEARRQVAELIREAFLASLQPDVIHVTSLFEGYVDDAVTSIGRFDTRTQVSVSLYDLIPLINPEHYLTPNPRYADYYFRKVDWLKQAACYLAISDFTKREGEQHLPTQGKRFVNVSTAIDSQFVPRQIDTASQNDLLRKFNLTRPFILYTGGADERKNLPCLINAYASLPRSIRGNHQLLFAGRMPQSNVEQFKQIARKTGLSKEELLFTGYVSDEELVQLYNLCKLYVFPSWHEGFGLPALEAMTCGAPVIGANNSSLPEAIGLNEALFDPLDTLAIRDKMAEALLDAGFRNRLREHGLQQAKKFSWDATALRAIKGWEALPAQRIAEQDWLSRSLAHSHLMAAIATSGTDPHELQLVSLSTCLAQNQCAGIERQLLLDVSELCQRDAATGVQRVVRSYLKWLLLSPPPGFRVEPVYATRKQGYRYARDYTQRFLGLETPGAADDPVRWQLGDLFFGLDMQHHVQLAHRAVYRQMQREGVTVKFLVYDLLPIQLADLFMDSDARELHEQWLSMIAATDGAICISKATADAYDTWLQHSAPPSPTFSTSWVHIGADIEGSQPSRGLPVDAENTLASLRQRPSFLCVSTLEPRKRQEQILEAAEELWQEGLDTNLVLVGQQGWKIEALAERLRQHPEAGRRLFWLQGISDEYLEKVYAASTCLIAASLNEGFGLSLIEAASHGTPIIARDIPVFREVAGEYAYYFQGDGPQDLAVAVRKWLVLYQAGKHPRSAGMPWSTWQQSADNLKAALIEKNNQRRQLLVDISELVQRDARTGIQRVVRSVLLEWLRNPPEGYRVEPIYAAVDHGYRYARQFTLQLPGVADSVLPDEAIDYAPGDVFFALDLQPQVQIAQRDFYQVLRKEGIRVKFMVYDLLCVLMPQFFPPGSGEGFSQWLEVVSESDGAVCISKSVADELVTWFEHKGKPRVRSFAVDWFHLGAEITGSESTQSVPQEASVTLKKLGDRPTFLMVGTLEPRKGHEQVLDAFDLLWGDGHEINLIIAGKKGWMIEDLTERLRDHPERNKRLFWLEGISDEYLEMVYAASTCLIAASYGEGFGLPLIEAAQHNLPIIARDIRIFREVAGSSAFYFSATSSVELSNSLLSWIALYNRGDSPCSNKINYLNWKESAHRLASSALNISALN